MRILLCLVLGGCTVWQEAAHVASDLGEGAPPPDLAQLDLAASPPADLAAAADLAQPDLLQPPMDLAPIGTPLFVAVGTVGRRVISANGSDWTNDVSDSAPVAGESNLDFRGIAYGDGTFVAVGGMMVGRSLTTTDGVTWTNDLRGGDLVAWLGGVVWQNGVFVTVGGNNARHRSTDRAASWSSGYSYAAYHWRAIAADENDLIVAVGHDYNVYDGLSMTTRDQGLTWTPAVSHTGKAPLWALAYGNGTFVAVGEDGRCAASRDGMTWKEHALGGQFWVPRGSVVSVSSDGENWTDRAANMPGAVVRGDDGTWVGVSWVDERWRSTNGTSYTRTVTSTSGASLGHLAFGRDRL
jgi:hypothetical protein